MGGALSFAPFSFSSTLGGRVSILSGGYSLLIELKNFAILSALSSVLRFSMRWFDSVKDAFAFSPGLAPISLRALKNLPGITVLSVSTFSWMYFF